ncbi:hypothetical protein [Flavobacterium anhuiense]|uniref:hypothetical protein n=1 Tax=Flavobacterium anhuiense TaxID=459526 RepID=UPI000E6BC213|nr:hypothetical protein [Flavobacterium anhuiense]
MSTKTLSKEAEIGLMNFFNDRIDPLDMARAIRQVNLTLALGVLNDQENIQTNATKLGEKKFARVVWWRHWKQP